MRAVNILGMRMIFSEKILQHFVLLMMLDRLVSLLHESFFSVTPYIVMQQKEKLVKGVINFN